jgi:hypothetical protein
VWRLWSRYAFPENKSSWKKTLSQTEKPAMIFYTLLAGVETSFSGQSVNQYTFPLK